VRPADPAIPVIPPPPRPSRNRAVQADQDGELMKTLVAASAAAATAPVPAPNPVIAEGPAPHQGSHTGGGTTVPPPPNPAPSNGWADYLGNPCSQADPECWPINPDDPNKGIPANGIGQCIVGREQVCTPKNQPPSPNWRRCGGGLMKKAVAAAVLAAAFVASTPLAHADANEQQVAAYAASSADATCASINNNPTVPGVMEANKLVGQAANGYFTVSQIGQIVRQGVIAKCPQHLPLLQQFMEAYQNDPEPFNPWN